MTADDDATLIKGRYYDGQRATGSEVTLRIDAYGVLHLDPPLRPAMPVAALHADTRIAGVPLSLGFDDDARIELADTPAHAAWLARHFTGTTRIARLEGSVRAILVAGLAVAVFVGATAVWGVPLLSRFVALQLPRDVAAPMAADTLTQLDRFLFKPSTLDAPRRAALTTRFDALLPPAGELHYRLEFRGGGMLGPNAIALPDGTIVVTDELIGIADSDDEVAAVLLHEIGHVEHRHSLRQILSHAGLAVMAGLLFGDVQALGGVLLAMPGMLMENAYSRELEWEADSYALAHLAAAGLRGADFTAILGRLERCADVVPDDRQAFVEACRARLKGDAAPHDGTPRAAVDDWHPYLSTHPSTAARRQRFIDAEAAPR